MKINQKGNKNVQIVKEVYRFVIIIVFHEKMFNFELFS